MAAARSGDAPPADGGDLVRDAARSDALVQDHSGDGDWSSTASVGSGGGSGPDSSSSGSGAGCEGFARLPGQPTFGDVSVDSRGGAGHTQVAGAIHNFYPPDRGHMIIVMPPSAGDRAERVLPDVRLRPDGELVVSAVAPEPTPAEHVAEAATAEPVGAPAAKFRRRKLFWALGVLVSLLVGVSVSLIATSSDQSTTTFPTTFAPTTTTTTTAEPSTATPAVVSLETTTSTSTDTSTNATEPSTPVPTVPSKVTLVPRADWGARPSKNTSGAHELPERVSGVAVHHSKTAPCFERTECVRVLVALQAENQVVLDDIMYNFLIGGDGLVYEGSGWLVAQHLYGWDTFILGVAFIGHFDDECPTPLQQAALANFLEFGVQISRLYYKYSVIGACALIDAPASPGPGRCFLAELRKWHNYWDDAHTDGSCPA